MKPTLSTHLLYVTRLSEKANRLEATAKELAAAIKEHVAIQKEEERMRKEYPAGTCNAEDAWSDFCDREEKSATNLRRLAKCKI